MTFQEKKGTIIWKLHFTSSPDKVYNMIVTDAGRAKYWAESAIESEGEIEFNIYNYPPFRGKILNKDFPVFAVEYYGTRVTFRVKSDQKKGTDLELVAEDVSEEIRVEMTAGWVSVLMAMKAAVDFGVDLRNHDPKRSWVHGFADN